MDDQSVLHPKLESQLETSIHFVVMFAAYHYKIAIRTKVRK